MEKEPPKYTDDIIIDSDLKSIITALPDKKQQKIEFKKNERDLCSRFAANLIYIRINMAIRCVTDKVRCNDDDTITVTLAKDDVLNSIGLYSDTKELLVEMYKKDGIEFITDRFYYDDDYSFSCVLKS
jgi:hypothetical protein